MDALGDMTPIELILFVQVAKSTIVQDCFSEVGQGTLTDWKGLSKVDLFIRGMFFSKQPSSGQFFTFCGYLG